MPLLLEIALRVLKSVQFFLPSFFRLHREIEFGAKIVQEKCKSLKEVLSAQCLVLSAQEFGSVGRPAWFFKTRIDFPPVFYFKYNP